MKYTINYLKRDVELDDELVEEYKKYDELHEQPFCIIFKTQFGHKPTEKELTDDELADICNEILLAELKAFGVLPKAIKIAQHHFDKEYISPMEFKI